MEIMVSAYGLKLLKQKLMFLLDIDRGYDYIYDCEEVVEDGDEYSEWYNLPDDILGKIISLLSVSDFTRMKFTCKSWMNSLSSSSLEYYSLAPKYPWLLRPQSLSSGSSSKSDNILTFMDLFEGKIRTLSLPDPVSGGWCCGSSKGWLVIAMGLELDPTLFLVNPLSGQTLPLPPLSKIPGYHEFSQTRGASKYKHGHDFIDKLEISSPRPADDDDCIVACIAFDHTALAFCEIGSSAWTLFGEPIDYDYDYDYNDDEEFVVHLDDMAFSNDGTTLYVYSADQQQETMYAETQPPATSSRITLSRQLVVKVISLTYEEGELEIFNSAQLNPMGDDSFIIEKFGFSVYVFVDTHTGKLLVVHKILDVMLNKFGPDLQHLLDEDDAEDLAEDENAPSVRYYKTAGFLVFSVDPHTGLVLSRLSALEGGDQTMILGEGGSFLMSSRDFDNATIGKFVRGNSIYFIEENDNSIGEGLFVSRELGIFEFNTGKIKRCFPSVPHPRLSKVLWFTPNPC